MSKPVYSLPVYSTEDYSIFKTLKGNRELSPTNVKRLVYAIGRDPEFTLRNPIKVNEKMEVVDGQHRIEAFRNYANNNNETPPIYYIPIKETGVQDARDINAVSKTWGAVDYARSYAIEGNSHYQTFLDFYQKYHMGTEATRLYLSQRSVGGRHSNQAFRTGEFKCGNIELAHRLCTQYKDIEELCPFNEKSRFAIAMYRFLMHPKYNHKRMREQLEKHGQGLMSVPQRATELVPAIHMIYNYDQKQPVNLLRN